MDRGMHVLLGDCTCHNQTAHSGMKVDFDKAQLLGLPGRLPTQLHRPTHPLRDTEGCPPCGDGPPSLPDARSREPLTLTPVQFCLFYPS